MAKIERNIQRDREVQELLLQQGWIVLRFWEHEIKEALESCLESVVLALAGSVFSKIKSVRDDKSSATRILPTQL